MSKQASNSKDCPDDSKDCPDCGETLKAAARRCRFCDYEFAPAAPALPAAEALPAVHSLPAVGPSQAAAPTPPALESGEVLDLLTRLVDKSLVVYEETADGQGRYRLLETVRQYARDRLLESGTGGAGRGRHRDFFLDLAEEAKSNLQGPEQARWLGRLESEHDNLRAALEWCLDDNEHDEAEEGAEAGLRLAGALWLFWRRRGHLSEGRKRSAAALSHPGAQARTKTRADALHGAGTLAWVQGDYASARALHQESLAIYRELGDKQGMAASLGNLGLVAYSQGDYASARSLYEESLAQRRELGDKQGIAGSLNNLGLVANEQGDTASARPLYEESLAILRELGNKHSIAASLINLGTVAGEQSDTASARVLFEESLAIYKELGDKQGIAHSLMNLGAVALDQGDTASARSLYEKGLAIMRELGEKQGIAIALSNLGPLACKARDYAASRSCLAECLTLCLVLGEKRITAYALEGCAGLAQAQEQPDRATRLYGASDALRTAIGVPLTPNDREAVEASLTALRATLGEEAFDSAWSAGRAMTWEQAIEYALAEPDVTAL